MARSDLDTYEDKVKRTFGDIEKKKNSSRSIQYSDNKVPYMADPNVREFNRVLLDKTFNGRPMRWDSKEELEEELKGFFELCDKTATIPTIVGISTWLGCDRQTLYNHAGNPNSPFFDTLKRVMNICQLSLENGAIGGKVNSVLYMFLGKNYHGLKDDKNITVTPSDPTQTNSQETMNAIQKQLEEETVPNADYHEE